LIGGLKDRVLEKRREEQSHFRRLQTYRIEAAGRVKEKKKVKKDHEGFKGRKVLYRGRKNLFLEKKKKGGKSQRERHAHLKITEVCFRPLNSNLGTASIDGEGKGGPQRREKNMKLKRGLSRGKGSALEEGHRLGGNDRHAEKELNTKGDVVAGNACEKGSRKKGMEVF